MGCALCLSTSISTSMRPIAWEVAQNGPDLSTSLVDKELTAALEDSGGTLGYGAAKEQAVAIPLQASEQSPPSVALEQAIQAAGAQNDPVGQSGELESLVANTQANYPLSVDMKVGNGDTLMNILTDTGVSYEQAQNVIQCMGKLYNPKKLDVGQNVSVVVDKDAKGDELFIASLRLPVSETASIEVQRDKNDKYSAKTVQVELQREPARANGRIQSSLYEAAMASGVPANVLNEIITAYSYDVDFQRDIHEGDRFDVLFESVQTKDGQAVGSGNVLHAQLHLGDKTLKMYRYTDKTGNVDYYNEKGESLRKALLRTPVNGARITSSFGMRNHPILGYTKMHRGMDFGAPTGTPIYAAGDGTVTFVGKKGGYGNYLSIKHDQKYSTAYAHISRFASGISNGKKVKQGQIVAYVGSTGNSTGPHLHYEVLQNNVQVNPAGLKFKTGNTLSGKELANFKKTVSQLQAQLESTPTLKTNMAMAEER